MLAHLHAKPTHALPRVQVRSRAPGQLWPRATGCKTAPKKKSSFSRSFPHARCPLAQTTPREFALFPVASVSGSTIFGYVEGNPVSKVDPAGEVAFLVPIIAGAAITGYGTYSLLNAQKKCEVACEMTHGDDVKACADPERDDILGSRKNQRILACKASCAFGSVMGRLLPGKLK